MAIKTDHIDRVYSEYAGIYDRVFGKVFQASRESVVRGLDIAPRERVLEVGVGTGLCLPLYPAHCEITAIDFSQGMLDIAAQRVATLGLANVKLQHMDAANMAFADDSFDIVVAAYVVTAVPDYRQVMREMVRVSRPGGRIVLLNHFTQDSKIIAAVEKAIAPLCTRLGFRTDLSVADVLNGWPLLAQRHERLMPLRMWRLIECINTKEPGQTFLPAGGHGAEEGLSVALAASGSERS